jgi:hypothetical protein
MDVNDVNVDALEEDNEEPIVGERVAEKKDVQSELPTLPLLASPQGASAASSSSKEVASDDAPMTGSLATKDGGENTSPTGPSAEILALLSQSTPAATGAPTGDRVNTEAMQRLHRSNELAARGAYYAAKTELIGVLKKVASTKDAIHGSVRRSEALTAGMQALDEAADFMEMPGSAGRHDQVTATAAAHATPLGKRGALTGLAPSQASDVYLRYAQLNLGAAVAGEPAGSMALHALGKLYSRLAAVEPSGDTLAQRRAFACQQAALLARNDNYMAAHELGVLLAESGHYQDAECVLRQVAERRTDRVVLQNLARVNRMLGQGELAARLERRAIALADGQSENASSRVVSPAAFASTSDHGRSAVSVATRPQPSVAAPVNRSAAPAAPEATPWYLK